MKTTILRTFGVALTLAIILAVSVARAETYTITIKPGYNFIANQLDNLGGNTLDQILPLTEDNDGSGVYKWDVGIQNYLPTSYWDGFALPPAWGNNFTLSPGEGALFNYASSSNFTLAFTGTRVSAPVPITPVPYKFQWMSDQLPEVGTWDSIIAVAPGAGTIVRRWDTGTHNWVANTFDGSAWSLGAPTANVGEPWHLYFVPVPEPATSALLGLGVIGLLICRRRR